MIHRSCDRCNRMIGHEEIRFIVDIDIQAAMGPGNEEGTSQAQLRELHEILEQLDPADHQELRDQALSQMQFDLCQGCHEFYRDNPLGEKLAPSVSIGFGPN